LNYDLTTATLEIDYQLPSIEIVPMPLEYRYVKSRDAVEPKFRKPKETASLYQDVIAAIALRSIYEVFQADYADALRIAKFNGTVMTDNPNLARTAKYSNFSIQVEKSTFMTLPLKQVLPSDLVSMVRGQNNNEKYQKAPPKPKPRTGTEKRSPYEVLGISPGVTLEDVTNAYKKQAQLYHPDKVAHLAPEFREIAELRMKEINQAFTALKKELRA
jgi:DnaJ domain